MFTYSDYITNDDLIPRGYDLTPDGVLDDTHFQNRQAAIDDFMQSACELVVDLIQQHRGRTWTESFLEDMKESDLTDTAAKYQEAFKKALVEQCIYTYDNGDSETQAYKGVSPYSPKAVHAIWGLIIGRSY